MTREQAHKIDILGGQNTDYPLSEPARHSSSLDVLSSASRERPPPTPTSTQSPKCGDPSSQTHRARSKARRTPPQASRQSNLKPSKRAPSTQVQPSKRRLQSEEGDAAQVFAHASKRRRRSSPNFSVPWFLDNWLDKTCSPNPANEAADAGGAVLTVKTANDIDQMSQEHGLSEPTAGSSVSGRSERLSTSSPLFRGVQKVHGLLVDNLGWKIPQDVENLVIEHLRKTPASARLHQDEVNEILRSIQAVWDTPESRASDIIAPPLFPINVPGLAQGRDIMWSYMPMPKKKGYSWALPAPKTDRHFGFMPDLASDWSFEELAVADHANMLPYSQPTKENIYPSFLIEVKSEAKGGDLYGAESQLASAGAHRVKSWIHTLALLDPNRAHSSADAVVFSMAVTQRQAVAYVHYLNAQDGLFYMSYIDHFYFRNDVQRCRDFVTNVVRWLLEDHQPKVREVLRKLYPKMREWKKTRIASVAESSESNSRSAKSTRLT